MCCTQQALDVLYIIFTRLFPGQWSLRVGDGSWCSEEIIKISGAGIAQLVVLGLAVHSVAGSILLWGHFPVEGIFPLELTWVQTPFPQKLLRMRV